MTEEEALKEEVEQFKQCCGSCIEFTSFHATAGFCKLEKCRCICKNPKLMIDMFDSKCDKWKYNSI